MNVAKRKYSGNLPCGKQMSQTVFVGPQLLHSEENNINANLSILIITFLDNIVTKTRCCPPMPLPAWSLTFHNFNTSTSQAPKLTTSLWSGSRETPGLNHFEMHSSIDNLNISTQAISKYQLHDHAQPRLPLSKTGLTQCAGNNDVTKRSCSPLKKVAKLKMFVNHFKLHKSLHKGARAPGKPPALPWSTSIFSTQRWQSAKPMQ